MHQKTCCIIFLTVVFCTPAALNANSIFANSGNYTSYLGLLVPGDTLHLAAGNYTHNLTIKDINGTAADPIVIMGTGATTVFQAQSCCNTVSITRCSYIIIKNLRLDGLNQYVDAVKAEGTTGNWAHHITLEYLHIINYGADQQNVGISTKCPAWNWIIRKNSIIGAGTGMYLGNSPGDKPFVNGIIEYNFVANTVGYNIEIKHQLNTVRDEFPGTAVNGKTIIRHNVFTKDGSSSTGSNARPNLLVGGFPTSGWGSMDFYEIYGNFFYNNPVEALFQGTGNIMLYDNIFVNHFDPPGFRAVYITPQNGVSPQDIKVFHNTVWTLNSSGGIRLYNPNTTYHQYCYGNAVFAPAPITNFTDSADNITDTYANAGNYVLSASGNINLLNLYPKNGQLTGTPTPSALFQNNTDWEEDFNGGHYDWTFRGAYSGCCINNGWHLQLDTMASPAAASTGIAPLARENEAVLCPNPVSTFLYISTGDTSPESIQVFDSAGRKVIAMLPVGTTSRIDFSDKPKGVYFIAINDGTRIIVRKILKL